MLESVISPFKTRHRNFEISLDKNFKLVKFWKPPEKPNNFWLSDQGVERVPPETSVRLETDRTSRVSILHEDSFRLLHYERQTHECSENTQTIDQNKPRTKPNSRGNTRWTRKWTDNTDKKVKTITNKRRTWFWWRWNTSYWCSFRNLILLHENVEFCRVWRFKLPIFLKILLVRIPRSIISFPLYFQDFGSIAFFL